MSEFKGTKGEWKINPRASRNVQCNGTTIANCSAGQSGDDEHIEIANAKLIACAPEMLEMLNKVDLLQSENYGNGMNTHLALIGLAREIRELIKKATE